MENGQMTLDHCKSEKRTYHKRDSDYWSTGIKEQRKKHPRETSETVDTTE